MGLNISRSGAVRLSITMMAHPKRADSIERIRQIIGLANVDVVLDEHSEGCWPTARRAWRHGAENRGAADKLPPTHVLVIQDDVLPCRDFARSVLRAIEANPRPPISLYANRAIVEEARAAGSSWAVIDDGTWGQAMVLPHRYVLPFLERTEEMMVASYPHDDCRLMYFLDELKVPVWCTVPSLVEHEGAAHSIMGHSNRKRVARWFIGEHVSGTTVDWTRGLDGAIHQKVSVAGFRKRNAKWFR